MNKLNSYESALTLYGNIFSHLKKREACYFLASIKYDFVFFFYALIWKGNNLDQQCPSAKNSKIGKRFFPRNFNEWKFGGRFISFKENNSNLWDIDKDYFRKDKRTKRNGEKLAVLTYGLDLERAFTLEELMKERKIGAVIDWKGDLKRNSSFKIIKKSKPFFSVSCFHFLFKNLRTLFRIHRLLIRNNQTNVALFDFLRYFFYPAFVSARIRYFLKILSQDKSIGAVIFSDIDNAWGNSFLFCSYFYGFRQNSYSHGFPIYNKNRYFNPEVCYVYATFHERIIKEGGGDTKTIFYLPAWLKKASISREIVKKEKVDNIAFITTMEINLEVPFPEKEKLMGYIDTLSNFICQKKLSLIIKSHKLLDWHKEYDGFVTKYPCLKHIKERWKEQDIRRVDLAVLASTETILALQLLSLGIPVITCSELMPKIWTDHFSIPYFQFVVQTKTELLELIERFLSDKEFYKKAQKEAKSIFYSVIKSKDFHK